MSQSRNMVGPFGEEVRNNNGDRLIEICDKYNLKITNGFYNPTDIHEI